MNWWEIEGFKGTEDVFSLIKDEDRAQVSQTLGSRLERPLQVAIQHQPARFGLDGKKRLEEKIKCDSHARYGYIKVKFLNP
jgi:hypothetical protein